MKIEEIFKIQIEIIINNNLHKKNIIDEKTFYDINDILLRKLKDFNYLRK